MMTPVRNPEYLVLTGPTAVGKTELSLYLAETLGAEIVSADSRQVYRELVIGTAQPTPEERLRVRHHFVAERSIRQPYTAGTYARDARARIEGIRLTGHEVLITGGSMLYIEALIRGLPDIPPVDPEIRRELEMKLKREGPEYLATWLRRVDPAYARPEHLANPRRVIRALEVYVQTGRPFSSFHARRMPPPFRTFPVILYREREELYDRIHRRVDAMLEEGLLEEVASLMSAGYSGKELPLQTIGYREPLAYLRGELTYEEMVEELKRNTRQYARRQLTWFRRRLPDALWLNLSRVSMDEARERVLQSFASSSAKKRSTSLPPLR